MVVVAYRILVSAQVLVFCPGPGPGQDLTGPDLDLDWTVPDLDRDLSLTKVLNKSCRVLSIFQIINTFDD